MNPNASFPAGFPFRLSTWCRLLVLGWFTAAFSAHAVPMLLQPPTTASVAAAGNADKSADFVFNEGMDREAVDVNWQGTGLDPAKIIYAWTPNAIPGFEIPALILECSYQGGWPAGIEVSWTLNPGNSGVMKSAAGQPLAQVSGNFTTPGSSGGSVTITPSGNTVDVGGSITFQFSAAMNTGIPATDVFQPSYGDWQSVWETSTRLKCTLTGGLEAGESAESTYELTGLRTAAGADVEDFAGSFTLNGPDAPEGPFLAGPPSTEIIAGTAGKAVFAFSEPMDPSGLDITWAGAGVDPAKITSTWVVVNVGGVVIPVTTVEATYEGGWPRSVTVQWTLNAGNSGVIRGASGIALAETSGSFVTPASGPGTNPGGIDVEECAEPAPGGSPVAGGSVTLLKELNFRQDGPEDPVFDPIERATVTSAVIASPSNSPPALPTAASLNRPVGGPVTLVKLSVDIPGIPLEIPDTFFLSTTAAPQITAPVFDSLESLDAAYPNGSYSMAVSLNSGGPKTVNLPLNPSPEPPAPKVANHAALQNFDPAQPLAIQWNAFAGAGEMDSIQLTVTEQGGVTAYVAPNRCANILLGVADTMHTIPAGTLRTNVTYELELTFHKVVHLHEASNTPNQPTHIQGYSELTLLTKTTRLYIGAPLQVSELRFSRVFLEANGVVSMEISGSLATGAIGIVEGSQDYGTWTPTGIIVSPAGLQALGGKIVVQDPAFVTGAPPYRFYRIVIQ